MNNFEAYSIHLSKLGKTPLLTKEEEIEISKKLDVADLKILKFCVGNKFFMKELLSLKKNVASKKTYVVKLTKKLKGDSTKKEVKFYRDLLLDILFLTEIWFEDFNKDLEKQIYDKLVEFTITNTALKSLLTNIESLASTIQNYQAQTAYNFNGLKIKNINEYNNLVLQSINNEFKVKYCKENQINILDFRKHVIAQEAILKYYQTQKLDINDLPIYLIKFIDKIKKINDQVQPLKNVLVNRNQLLVVSRVKYFLNKGFEYYDLVQEGNLGLIKAVDKFEHQRGVRFSTHATWWINQSIQRALSNRSRTIRIPVHLQDQIVKINKAMSVLKIEKENCFSNKDIAELAGLTEEQVRSALMLPIPPLSIETELTKDLQLKDIIQATDDDNANPYLVTAKKLFAKTIHEIIGELSPRSQKLIRLRFGIGESKPHTLDEIASELGLTKMRIKQLETMALEKMKNSNNLNKLGDLND